MLRNRTISKSRHSLRVERLLALLTSSAIAAVLLLIAPIARSQGIFGTPPTPVDTRPGGGAVQEKWIPDCSEENWAGVITDKVFSTKIDNLGNPILDTLPWFQARHTKGRTQITFSNQAAHDLRYERTFDIAPANSGGAMIAYQSMHQVSVFDNSGGPKLIRDPYRGCEDFYAGYRVYIQGINNDGTLNNTYAGLVDDPDAATAEIHPKIVETSDGGFIVTYISVDPSISATQSYTLMMAKYISGGRAWNVSVSPGQSFAKIPDYSLAADGNGGGVVLMFAHENSTDTFYYALAQSVDNSGAQQWSDLLQMRGVDIARTYKHNPIIKENPISGLFDMAWGSYNPNVVKIPNAKDTLCRNNIDISNGNFGWSSGNSTLTYIDKIDLTEFYMTPFPYDPFGTSPVAAVAFLVKDDGGKLETRLFTESSGPGIITTYNHFDGLPNNTASIPGGIVEDNTYTHHLIVSWLDGSGGATAVCGAHSFYTRFAGTYWSSALTIQSGITSRVFQPTMTMNNDSTALFMVIPDEKKEYVAKINPVQSRTLTYCTSNTVRTRYWEPALAINSTFGIGSNGVYQTACISSGNLVRMHFECGITPFQQSYFDEEMYDIHGERQRESYALNSNLNVQAYDLSAGSLSAQFGNPTIIEGTPFQRALHSAAFENVEACVYEQHTLDGKIDVYIAKRGASPLKLTSATSSINYIRPKIGVCYNSSTPYATVTYVKEYNSSGLKSDLYSRAVDLSTMIPTSPVLVDAGTGELSTRNYDLVHDSGTGCHYAIYGQDYSPQNIVNTRLLAQRIDYGGSYGWGGPVGISTTGTLKDQVQACFGTQYQHGNGVYIVWHDLNNGDHSIGIQFLDNSSATWAPGDTTIDVDATRRRYPCVAAGPRFVMFAWEDYRTSGGTGGTGFNSHIYVCGFNDTAVVLPIYTNSQQIDDPTTIAALTGEASETTTSFRPSIVASVPNDADTNKQGALVAFTECNDQHFLHGYAAGGSNFNMRIGVRFGWAKKKNGGASIPAAFPSQWNMSFSPNPNPNTFETLSMFGSYQQAPKLIQMESNDADLFNLTGYNDPPVLCVFETESYRTTDHDEWERLNVSNVSASTNDQEMYVMGSLQESNLVAKLLTPKGDKTFSHYCIASGHNKEILGGIHHTTAAGFNAYYVSYDSSDNHAGEVKNVVVDNQVFFDQIAMMGGPGTAVDTTTFGPAIPGPYWKNTPNPVPPAFPINRLYDTKNITIYNRSACIMTFRSPFPAVFADRIAPPYPNYIGGGFSFKQPVFPSSISAYGADNTTQVYYSPITFGRRDTSLMSIVISAGSDCITTFPKAMPMTGSAKPSVATEHNIVSPYGISIVPNPASYQATVTITGANDRRIDIELIGISGQKVYSTYSNPSPNNETKIPLSLGSLASGNYFARILVDGGVVSQRLITINR